MDGEVLWNNYYGVESSLTNAMRSGGRAHSVIVDGSQLLVGGVSSDYSGLFAPNILGGKKFLTSINKTTGKLNWKKAFETERPGEIFEIVKEGNKYLLSGIEFDKDAPNYFRQEGFATMYSGSGSQATFQSPVFDFTSDDASVESLIDNEPSLPFNIDSDLHQKCTSAIISDGKVYWFLMINAENTFANQIEQGLVIQADFSGNLLDIDYIGEVRAFDMYMSGVKTDDGGFALVTSKQSPKYFNGGSPIIPTRAEYLDPENHSLGTIGDCMETLWSGCAGLIDGSDVFEMMSTCSYVRKYGPNFTFEWDKIWDSAGNAPRECFPGNLKQQECVYRIVQSEVDGGLALIGNTSSNFDDGYMVKLKPDCAIADFIGEAPSNDLIVDYDDGLYELTATNTVWNTPKKVLGNVVVPAGKTLTIQSTTVEFAGNDAMRSGIIVEQDGLLIVDNSTLTNMTGCGEFWRGIQVYGDTDKDQYAHSGHYFQGRAIIRNESTIENARNGLTNWKSGDFNAIGGIIQVKETDFTNCFRAAEFMSYQNHSPSNPNIKRPEQSFFKLCNFLSDDGYHDNLETTPPYACITMWKTDRLRIEGCSFINTTSVSTSEGRRNAIFSSDANYVVHGYCNDPVSHIDGCRDLTESTFTGWHKAIEATESSSGRAIQVSNSNFHKNMIGVVLKSGVDGSEIFKNHFFLGDHPYDYEVPPILPELNQLGIYTDETHLFTIEDNEFKKATTATEDAHGVLIYNSKGYDNEIYNNTFDDMKVAANGWQVNRNANPYKIYPAGAIGLQFLCNTNEGNEIDFKMSRTNDFPVEYSYSGMRTNQGDDSPSKGANDKFSAASPDPNIYTHWTIDTDNAIFFRYNYHSNPPLSSEITPGKMLLYVTSNDNTCVSHYYGGVVISPIGKMMAATNELGGLEYTYAQLIDEGNTQNILNDIALSWPNDAWELRDELMARSPYNSEKVLIAAAKKEIMPHAMLLEVLLANPDVIAQGQIIKVVEYELMNPMPSYMVDMLYLARDEKTLRTSMQNSISHWHAKASRYQKAALDSKVFDLSETDEPDSTLWILSQLKTPQSDLARANILAGQDNYTAAIALIDSVDDAYKLLPSQAQNLTELKGLFNFFEQIKTAGKELPDLPADDLTALKGFAENGTGTAAQKAQNALCFHYGICYDSEGNPKSNPSPKSNDPKPDKKEVLSHFNNANAFPSPARSYTTIGYDLLYAIEKTQLNVYDAVGRKILTRKLGKTYQGQELIDTRKQSNGLYVYEITQDGNQVVNGKFIVNR